MNAGLGAQRHSVNQSKTKKVVPKIFLLLSGVEARIISHSEGSLSSLCFVLEADE